MAYQDAPPRMGTGPYATYGTVSPSTEGVLARRAVAYLVDLLVISLWCGVLAVVIAFAGVVTFGLGWALYGILVPGTAILYSALTVGGSRQGTVGMRVAGLSAHDAATGAPVGVLRAGVHAILFYLAAGTLLIVFDVLVGLVRPDRRLGHDLMTGLVLVRRDGAR